VLHYEDFGWKSLFRNSMLLNNPAKLKTIMLMSIISASVECFGVIQQNMFRRLAGMWVYPHNPCYSSSL